MTVYPDTSFLVSRYRTDAHSPEVDRRLATQPRVFVTPFHRAELANAIYQQAFRGLMSTAAVQLAFSDFEQDCALGVFVLAPMPERSYQRCVELARRHVATLGTRTLDTLHVAAALELKADRFWTFDQRQETLAEAEGLATA